MNAVIDAMIYQQRKKGDVVCSQGDNADRIYVLIKGRCAVSSCAPSSTQEVRVGSLSELEVFGESALLEHEEDRIRNATVRVESDRAQLLVLKRSKYEDLVESRVLDHSQFVTRVKSSRHPHLKMVKALIPKTPESYIKLLQRRKSFSEKVLFLLMFLFLWALVPRRL